MAVVLRLTRTGKHKNPSYRIIATERQSRRDGKFLQVLGTYQPKHNPSIITLKEDLVRKWLAVGAVPSMTVRSIIRKQIPGLIEEREKHQKDKVQAARRARKERQKARAK